MSDRLFDIAGIPEIPFFREPRHGKGALILDERISHDYPREWSTCQTCDGFGYRWSRDGGRSFACPNFAADPSTVPGYGGTEGPWEKIACGACLGMGSLKAMTRLAAGHRCVRCGHPYVPKGDAKKLGVPLTPGHWSPCDPRCSHGGPIRWCEAGEDEGARNWRYLDFLQGQPAGDGIVDRGPSGEWIERYLVEAEWRILTVHHLDGDKANCRWWNLAALCQRCHLEIQAKVVIERVYPHEHTDWFRPYAAGYYAFVYLGEDLSRDEVDARMDELLALERTPA